MSAAIHVILPDGAKRELPAGATGRDLAMAISPRLAAVVVGAKINGQVSDLTQTLPDGATVELIKPESPDGLFLQRHSCAHVMAEAITRLHPGAQLVYGPPVEDGYYYDMAMKEPLTPDQFAAIEAEMAKIIAEDRPFTRFEMTRDEGRARLKGDKYKTDNLERATGDVISFYATGQRDKNWEDLCRGPHVPSTGKIGAFKIMSVAGSYWHGDAESDKLVRVYGTAFASKKDLDQHLWRIEEAKKRDHRKLGQELDLFLQREEAPGDMFLLNNGCWLFERVTNFVREHLRKRKYIEVRTPQILDQKLWERSGHWEKFRDLMFTTQSEKRTFAIKPMNCPGACLIFGSKRRSYRELPLRIAEFGRDHRNEPSGTLMGILRVRAFTQDDAHIYLPLDLIGAEIDQLLDMTYEIYSTFGFSDIGVKVATRPAVRFGDDAAWDLAEKALCDALKKKQVPFEINPGEGAFYGPKIEVNIRDAIGRHWQCGTIQVDFVLPERFELNYVGQDNGRHRPVMIHRAILGSLERFIGVLIEHYAGAFPIWLSPVQVRLASFTDRHVEAAQKIADQMNAAGLRIDTDFDNDKVNNKARLFEETKIPYFMVIGDKEIESGVVGIRGRGRKDLGKLSIADFIAKVQKQDAERKE
ncbi:MAG TPA: threonine--tRNA ligase [Planctomycetota bacterium]|nr:threonine--tRNA ligase [Planctomycetota bacterium]